MVQKRDRLIDSARKAFHNMTSKNGRIGVLNNFLIFGNAQINQPQFALGFFEPDIFQSIPPRKNQPQRGVDKQFLETPQCRFWLSPQAPKIDPIYLAAIRSSVTYFFQNL